MRAADGTALAEELEIQARWAGYVEVLHLVKHPDREFPGDAAAVQDADGP